MKFIAPLSVILMLSFQGCATKEKTVGDVTDNRPCAANFSTEGGFWSGTQYKTYQIFPKASKALAFDSLMGSIASAGFQVTSSNKESGLISANQTVSYGQGKTAPINAVIQGNQSGGVRVDLVFSLSGGVVTSADSVKNEFCKYLSSVSQAAEAETSKVPPIAPIEPTKAKSKPKKQ